MKIRRRAVANEALSEKARLGSAWRKRRRVATQLVGVAWYTKREWARLREGADDPDALDDTYEAWQCKADETVAVLRAKGLLVQKVLLNVDVVAAWCVERGRPFNGAERASFVMELLQKGS